MPKPVTASDLLSENFWQSLTESVTSSTKVASLPRRAPALTRHAEPQLVEEFPALKASGQGEELEIPARLSICCVQSVERSNTFAEVATSVVSAPLYNSGPIMNDFLIGRLMTREQSHLVGPSVRRVHHFHVFRDPLILYFIHGIQWFLQFWAFRARTLDTGSGIRSVVHLMHGFLGTLNMDVKGF